MEIVRKRIKGGDQGSNKAWTSAKTIPGLYIVIKTRGISFDLTDRYFDGGHSARGGKTAQSRLPFEVLYA